MKAEHRQMFKQNQKTFSATLVFNISSVHEVMLWFCKMSKLLRGVVLLFLFFLCVTSQIYHPDNA